MEGYGIPGWEPLLKGMCYMDGMCFAMLTPMLCISVCREICGVTRGKDLAHVPVVSSIALDQVYHTYSACGKAYRATHKRHYQFSHIHGACREEVQRCPYASMWGWKWGYCWQMVRSSCALNHMLIPWVSEGIYYCDYFEFGNICMFLTSFYADFCILWAQLVG